MKNQNTKSGAVKTAYKISPAASSGFNTKTTKVVILAALVAVEKKLATINKKAGVKASFAPSGKHDAKTLKPTVLADLLAVEKKLLAMEIKVGKSKIAGAKPLGGKAKPVPAIKATAPTPITLVKSEPNKVTAPTFDEKAALALPMLGSTNSVFTPVFANRVGRVGFRNIGNGSVRVRVELAKKGTSLDLSGWKAPDMDQNRYSMICSSGNKDNRVIEARVALQDVVLQAAA